jgi:ABC-type multidrug transport system ATPase subunit
MILCADSVGKSYGRRRVLSSASLRVPEGKIVGLLGRMGEGKSTLLKTCAGMAQPDSGWIRFAGVQYFRARLSTLAARGMYYLADDNNLASSLTLRAHIRVVERRYGMANSDQIIAQLKLEPLLDSLPAALSGGEQRRAELAVAMLRRPLCLLADEPFRGIDPLTAELVGSALRQLSAAGCGIVLTGHEVRTLLPYVDTIAWMTAGTTYDLGTPESAWRNEQFQRAYLGPLATDPSRREDPPPQLGQ